MSFEFSSGKCQDKAGLQLQAILLQKTCVTYFENVCTVPRLVFALHIASQWCHVTRMHEPISNSDTSTNIWLLSNLKTVHSSRRQQQIMCFAALFFFNIQPALETSICREHAGFQRERSSRFQRARCAEDRTMLAVLVQLPPSHTDRPNEAIDISALSATGFQRRQTIHDKDKSLFAPQTVKFICRKLHKLLKSIQNILGTHEYTYSSISQLTKAESCTQFESFCTWGASHFNLHASCSTQRLRVRLYKIFGLLFCFAKLHVEVGV